MKFWPLGLDAECPLFQKPGTGHGLIAHAIIIFLLFYHHLTIRERGTWIER